MGDYVDYYVKVRGKNLQNLLLQNQPEDLIIRDPRDMSVYLFNAKKYAPEAYKKYVDNIYACAKENEWATTLEECQEQYQNCWFRFAGDEQISYYNKWTYNEYPIDCLSEYFKDEIFEVSYDFEYYEHFHFLIKNKELCNTLGEPANFLIKSHKNTLINEANDTQYKISVYVDGEWGTIYANKENVCFEASDFTTHTNVYVPTTTEKIKLYTNGGMKTLSVEEFVQKFKDSREAFKERMRTPIRLNNIPRENLFQPPNKNFYIFTIARDEFSKTTMCISDYNVTEHGDGTCSVFLGTYGSRRNCRVTNMDGTVISKDMTMHEVENMYNECFQIRTQPQEQETEYNEEYEM